MKEHMNIHTLEETYSCLWPNCEKQFTLKTTLNCHMRRHKGLDYKCKYNGCEYQTTNTIRYKNHLKTHEINE